MRLEVKSIVLNGEIIVDSKLGSGTIFCVYLPVNNIVSHEDIKKIEPIPKGNERILFVDDDRTLSFMHKIVLEKLGYKITEKTSSRDALNTFKKSVDHFDLVITDMTMPEMTGVQLAKQILKIKSAMPIILCTGYSELINQEQAKAMGIKGYLTKPILKRDLAEMV